RFRGQHRRLKIQLQPTINFGNESATIVVHAVGIAEPLREIRRLFRAEDLSLAMLNRQFRDGAYMWALYGYLIRSEGADLSLYGQNAALAARRAGFAWVEGPDDLGWITEA